MTSYLESVNAGSFYLLVAAILGLMTALCAVFLIKSYRAGIAIGMDPKVLKKTITSSAAFTLLPSVSILLGVIALSGTLGVPFSWLKGQFSFQSQRNAMPKDAQSTTQLHSSHTLLK